MAYCYILYSPSLGKFYVGSTELTPTERLELHNTQFYGSKKYTSKVNDWRIHIEIQCKSIQQARLIEAHIKHMKSTTYLENLKKYPEIINKLLTKY